VNACGWNSVPSGRPANPSRRASLPAIGSLGCPRRGEVRCAESGLRPSQPLAALAAPRRGSLRWPESFLRPCRPLAAIADWKNSGDEQGVRSRPVLPPEDGPDRRARKGCPRIESARIQMIPSPLRGGGKGGGRVQEPRPTGKASHSEWWRPPRCGSRGRRRPAQTPARLK